MAVFLFDHHCQFLCVLLHLVPTTAWGVLEPSLAARENNLYLDAQICVSTALPTSSLFYLSVCSYVIVHSVVDAYLRM